MNKLCKTSFANKLHVKLLECIVLAGYIVLTSNVPNMTMYILNTFLESLAIIWNEEGKPKMSVLFFFSK